MIDVAIPANSDIRKKEHEKIKKYQGLEEQLKELLKVKSKVVPEVIGAFGALTPKLEEWLDPIQQNLQTPRPPVESPSLRNAHMYTQPPQDGKEGKLLFIDMTENKTTHTRSLLIGEGRLH